MASQIGGHSPGTALAGQLVLGATANPQVATATASSNRMSPPGTARAATI
jgi:hypothetical protein